MILYTENPKDATKKLLELINEFGKVVEHKTNMQKSAVFLYTINELSQKEIKVKNSSFTAISKGMNM